MRLSFSESKRAWLLHRGEYYLVATMPSKLFRDIVMATCPYSNRDPILHQAEIDQFERWCVLTRHPVKLYYLNNGIFAENDK